MQLPLEKGLKMRNNITYLALMVLFLSILVYFGGRDSKKPRGAGAVSKWGPISKNLDSQFFWTKGKNLTPR